MAAPYDDPWADWRRQSSEAALSRDAEMSETAATGGMSSRPTAETYPDDPSDRRADGEVSGDFVAGQSGDWRGRTSPGDTATGPNTDSGDQRAEEGDRASDGHHSTGSGGWWPESDRWWRRGATGESYSTTTSQARRQWTSEEWRQWNDWWQRNSGADDAARPSVTSTSPPSTTTRTGTTSTARTTSTPISPGHNGAGAGKGPSEKLLIPTFSGEAGDMAEIGSSARSYLRQVDAWQRMTKLSTDQQALVLYQHLQGSAWVNAESLDVGCLATSAGVEHLKDWVRQHYLDVEVTLVGRSLSDLFRKLKRKPQQTFRDYAAEFNRLLARVTECGCRLPDVANAWLFVDRANLDEQTEVSLLASVGNRYELKALQQAAIILDRSMRKPWEKPRHFENRDPRRAQTVHQTEEYGRDDEGHSSEDEPPSIDDPDIDGEALYVSYMTAKARYKEVTKSRGVVTTGDPTAAKKAAEEKIRLAKSRSHCSACGQKGHWHRDSVCPKHKDKAGAQTIHVTNDIMELIHGNNLDLLAILDSACSKSVVGTTWLQRYLDHIKGKGRDVDFVYEKEAFKFGAASRVYESTYAAVILVPIQGRWVGIKAAVIHGELPLLLSKPALSRLGLVLDLGSNTANFKAIDSGEIELAATASGHPAIRVGHGNGREPDVKMLPRQWEGHGVSILAPREVYMVAPGSCPTSPCSPPVLFYGKKLGPFIKDMLVADSLNTDAFYDWWSSTKLSSDFWIECPDRLVRVHVTPRKNFFDPRSWQTTHTLQRTLLLDALGSLRESWGIACVTQCTLNVITEDWRSRETASGYSTLWIGRSVFNRASGQRPTPTWNPSPCDEHSDAQLLAECTKRGLAVSPKWTCPELRTILVNSPIPTDEGLQLPKGLSSMSLAELRLEAARVEVEFSEKDTKGALMLKIRDAVAPNETVMTLGRFKGSSYADIPENYGAWASEEEKVNGTNMHPDLKRFVVWRRRHRTKEQKPKEEPNPYYLDPEKNAMVPPPPMSETGCSAASWALLGEGYVQHQISSTTTTTAPLVRPEVTRLAATTPETSSSGRRTRQREESEKERMTQDVTPEVMSEIQALEARLATLKEATVPADELDAFMTIQLEAKDGDHAGERLAAQGLRDEDFRTETLLAILEKYNFSDLHGGQRPRVLTHGREPVDRGAHGAFKGITRKTLKWPLLLRYVNAFLGDDWEHGDGRRADRDRRSWTSLSISHNVPSEMHTDKNNLKGSRNYTLCVGEYEGGGLWLEQPGGGVWRRGPHADEVEGIVIDNKDQLCEFDPRLRHASQPWTGNRWSITAYTKGREEAPLRSQRKKVRRKAAALSVLLATAISVFTGVCCDTLPERMSPSNALLEVGGISATCRLAEFCPQTVNIAEPITLDDLLDNDHPEDASFGLVEAAVMREEPGELWIHVREEWTDTNIYEDMMEAIETQLRSRRAVIFQRALEEDEVWEQMTSGWCEAGYKVTHDVGENQEELIRVIQHEEEPGVHEVMIGDTVISMVTGKETNIDDELENVSGTNTSGSEGVDDDPVAAESKGDRAGKTVYAEGVLPPGDEGRDQPLERGARAIKFPPSVPGHIASSLRRLHQNLGHPSTADFVRRLRLAGASRAVLKAARSLTCETCRRTKATAAAKPAKIGSCLRFNNVVGADLIYVHDSEGVKHQLLSVVDFSSAYHIVIPVARKDTPHLEKAFCEHWLNVFGTPTVVAVDLENGLEKAFAKISDWTGTKIKNAAGQAHWQAGFVERHGGTWKAIFARIVDEMSVQKGDMHLAIAAVSSAKNGLARSGGYSPVQHVFGSTPNLPEDLLDGPHANRPGDEPIIDDKHAREVAIRTAARAAFHVVQTDDRVRRALAGRARVQDRAPEPGEQVFFYRKAKNAKRGSWLGPGTVIGPEGNNLWVTRGGRCFLCAPEHLRLSTPEELGQAFSFKAAKEDLDRLLNTELETDEEFPAQTDLDIGEAPEGGISDVGSHVVPTDEEMMDPDDDDERTDGHPPRGRRRVHEGPPPYQVMKRHRRKGPPDPPREAMMLKQAKTRRSREKQMEKELPWNSIPESKREEFRAAEAKQWKEHLDHNAIEVLSLSDSELIRRSVPGERILNSRYAYRDKNLGKRRANPDLPWKPKARLVVAGHQDPDVLTSDAPVDSPTVARSSLMALLQICASRRWTAAAGDVQAAFLNGLELQRDLWMKQPRGGVDGLHPDQLVKIRKGIFGLSESPRRWYERLCNVLLNEVFAVDGNDYVLKPCPLDPCVFMLVPKDFKGEPVAYLAIHVDDILVIADKKLNRLLQARLSELFRWMVGKRLFRVDVRKDQRAEDPAEEEQIIDNRSLVGALSWLATQSRPDLQCSVALAQQLQRAPTVGDVRFTNTIVDRANLHKDEGINLPPVDLDRAVFVVYHDAAWANAELEVAEAGFQLTPEEVRLGNIGGPFGPDRPRKPKRAGSKLASQIGHMIMLFDEKLASGCLAIGGMLEWRSQSCKRVCRSTFGAETMAGVEGLEGGQYTRSLFATLLKGDLVKVEEARSRWPLLCLTDCKSLFDHLQKTGVPRVPSDRRLAIDLTALRMELLVERWHAKIPLLWIPTGDQIADPLTKPMNCEEWWQRMKKGIRLPFRSGWLQAHEMSFVCGKADRCVALLALRCLPVSGELPCGEFRQLLLFDALESGALKVWLEKLNAAAALLRHSPAGVNFEGVRAAFAPFASSSALF
ncbi:RE1 [Symbiodinium natans]|uniref:RE1 protein n=1 Tax=Symbiodinium natans TaxID=878477 RepID=A0A812L0R8_9DINO|nr:RE1 [Symbiodinium natans]